MTPPPPSPGRRRPAVLAGLAVVAAATAAGGYFWWAGRGPAAARADGLKLARGGDFAAAAPLLEAAAKHRPDDPEVVGELARGYAATDDARAEPYLARWAALAPTGPDPFATAVAYFHKRKDARAYPAARALSDLAPGDDKARRAAMNHAFSYGAFADAEALCRGLLQKAPKDPDLRRLLAQTRRAQNDSAGAAAVLDDVLADYPKLSGPLLARAELHLAAGEPDKAAPLLRVVYDGDRPLRRAAGYLLALALEQSGKDAEAAPVRAEVRRLQDVEIALGAISSRPDDLALQVRLAEQLRADGYAADAVGLLEQLLARAPGFAAAHRVLADHYEKAGDAARAADHRRRAGP